MGTIGLIVVGIFVLMIVIHLFGDIIKFLWKASGKIAKMILFVVVIYLIALILSFSSPT